MRAEIEATVFRAQTGETVARRIKPQTGCTWSRRGVDPSSGLARPDAPTPPPPLPPVALTGQVQRSQTGGRSLHPSLIPRDPRRQKGAAIRSPQTHLAGPNGCGEGLWATDSPGGNRGEFRHVSTQINTQLPARIILSGPSVVSCDLGRRLRLLEFGCE